MLTSEIFRHTRRGSGNAAVYAKVAADASDVETPAVVGGATSAHSKGLWEVK